MEALNGKDEHLTSIFPSESSLKENILFSQGTVDMADESVVGQRRLHQPLGNTE